MATQIKFFQPASDETPNTNELHAYREESPQALCGEASLSYNRDAVFDAVPDNAALHLGCREAIDAENPAPYQPWAADTETTTEEQTITDGDVASLNDVLGVTETNAVGSETDTTSEAGADATDSVPDDAATADQPQTDQPQP